MAAPPPLAPTSSEDILNDALAFLGGEPVIESTDDDGIRYGPLRLTVAAKAGKASPPPPHSHQTPQPTQRQSI